MDSMNLLHNMTMADHVEEKLSQNRRDLRHYREQGAQGYLQTPRPSPDEESDPMKIISAGNVSVFHAPESSQPPPSPAPSSSLGSLAKFAIGAGLLATGAGGAVGIPMLLDALRKPAETIQRTIERDYSIGEVKIEGVN